MRTGTNRFLSLLLTLCLLTGMLPVYSHAESVTTPTDLNPPMTLTDAPTLTVQHGGSALSEAHTNDVHIGDNLTAVPQNCTVASYSWYAYVLTGFMQIGSEQTLNIPESIPYGETNLSTIHYAGEIYCEATLDDGTKVKSPSYDIFIPLNDTPSPLVSNTEGKYTVGTVLSFDKDTEYFKKTYGLTTYDTGKGCYHWGAKKADNPDSSAATYTLTPADLQGPEHTITGWMYLENQFGKFSIYNAYPATYTIPANNEWTLENGILTFKSDYNAGTTRFPVDGLTYSKVNTDDNIVTVNATANGDPVTLVYGQPLANALSYATDMNDDIEYAWFRLTADGPIKISWNSNETVSFATHNQTFKSINGYPYISMKGLNRTSYIGDTVTITTGGMPDGFKVQLVYSYNNKEYASFDLNPTAPGSNSYSFTLPVKTFDSKPLSGIFTVTARAVGGENQVLAETQTSSTIVPRITITKSGTEGVFVAGDELSVPDAEKMMSNYCLSVSSVLPYSWDCASLSYALGTNTSYSLTNVDLGNMDKQTNIISCHIVLQNDSTGKKFSVDPTFELPQNSLWDYSENDGFTLIGDYDGSASQAYPLPKNGRIIINSGKKLYNFHLDQAIVNNYGTIYDTTFTSCSVESNTGAIHVPVTIGKTTYTSTPDSDVKFLYGENTLATLNAWYENLHGNGSSKDLVWVDTSTNKQVTDSDKLALSDNSFILFGRMQVNIDAPTGYYVGSKLYADVKLETSFENVSLATEWRQVGSSWFVPSSSYTLRDEDIDRIIKLTVTATYGDYSVTRVILSEIVTAPEYKVLVDYENESLTISTTSDETMMVQLNGGTYVGFSNGSPCIKPLSDLGFAGNEDTVTVSISVWYQKDGNSVPPLSGLRSVTLTRTPTTGISADDFTIAPATTGDPRNVTINCKEPGKYKEIRVAGKVYPMTDSGEIVASVPAGADVTVEARLRGNDTARLLPSLWGAVGTIKASEWPYLYVTENNLLSDSSSLFWGETLTVETNAELTWVINDEVVEDPSTVKDGVHTYFVPADVNTLTITATKNGQTVTYTANPKCPITVTLNYAYQTCTVALDNDVTSGCQVVLTNDRKELAINSNIYLTNESYPTYTFSLSNPTDYMSYLPLTLEFEMDIPVLVSLLSVPLARFPGSKDLVTAKLHELYCTGSYWRAGYDLLTNNDSDTRLEIYDKVFRDKDNRPCAANQLVAGQTYSLFAKMYSVDEYGIQNSFVSDWFDTGLTVTPGIWLDSYTPVVGQTITATSAQIASGTTSAWNWHRLTETTDSPISDATSNRYTVTMADVGYTLRACHVLNYYSNGQSLPYSNAFVETTAAVPQPTIEVMDDRGNVLVKNEHTGSYLVEPGTKVTANMTNYVGNISWTWSDGTSGTDSFTLSYAHPRVTLSNNLTNETAQIQIILPSPSFHLDYVNETLVMEKDASLPNFDEAAKEGAEIALQIVELVGETTNTLKTLTVTTDSLPLNISLSSLNENWPGNQAHNLLFRWQVKPNAAGTYQDIINSASVLTIPARPTVTKADMAAALTHDTTPYSITYTGDAAHEMRIKLNGAVITGEALQNLTYSTTYQLEGRLLASNEENPHFASEWVYACDETTLARYTVTPVFGTFTYGPGMSLSEADLLKKLDFSDGGNYFLPYPSGSVSLALSEGSFPITNAGTYKVKLTTTQDFDKGFVLTNTECDLTVSSYSIENYFINIPELTYTGSPLTPSYYINCNMYGSETYIDVELTSSDYDIEWIRDSNTGDVVSEIKNAGEYTVYLKGKGNYTGTTFAKPKVSPRDISNDCVVAPLSTQYDGTAKTLTVSVDGRTLTKDTDYTVTLTRGDQPVTEIKDAGTYTVILKGIGNYTGTYETTVTVTPISITGGSVTFAETDVTATHYSASKKALKVKLNDGTELVANQDYTLSVTQDGAAAPLYYAGYYDVTVTGAGNYTGSLTDTLTINPYVLQLTGATLRDKYYAEGSEGYVSLRSVLVDSYTTSNALFPVDAGNVTITCLAALSSSTDVNAGTDKPVDVWLVFDSTNRQLVQSYATTVFTGTITVKPMPVQVALDFDSLTYTGESTYDLSAQAIKASFPVSVLSYCQDQLQPTAIGKASAKATLKSGTGTVGEPNDFTVSGVTFEGTPFENGNAELVYADNYSITLNPRTLDGAQVTVTPGVYNGKPQQLTLTLTDGTVLTHDQLTLPVDADLTSAGTRSLVIGSTLYAYTGVTTTVSITIAPAPLTVAQTGNIAFTYSGTTAFDLQDTSALTLSGTISGDDVSLSDVSLTLDSKNAQTAPHQAAISATLTGAAAANYALQPDQTCQVIVNRKDITVVPESPENFAYTGTTDVPMTGTGWALEGTIAGDDVALDLTNLTATVAEATVGEDKPVTITGWALKGADTDNYTVTAVTPRTVTIVPAQPPTIEWPTPGAITYGDALRKSALTNDAHGTFAWQSGDTILTAGLHLQNVVYTPADTINYDYSTTTLTKALPVQVAKAPAASIVWPTASAITYGEALRASTLTSADKSGSFAWQAGDSILSAGTHEQTVVYTPADAANFDYTGIALTATVPVTVNKAPAPAIAWPGTVPAITYGDALSAASLPTDEHGTFAWQSADTTLPAGTHTQTIAYTPADTANYDYTGVTLAQTVSVTVNKAPAPAIVWPKTGAAITYGDALRKSTLTDDAHGTFAWQSGDTVLTAGTHTQTIVYSPADTANYDYTDVTLTAAATVTVAKAPAPVIVWPTASTLTYGEALRASTLTSADKNGTFAWKAPSQTLAAGEQTATVVYTPADKANYDYRGVTLEKKIAVQVNKAATVIDVSGVKTAYTYTGKLQTVDTGAKLNHREAKAAYANNTFTTVREGNGLTVTITAPETANYLASEATVTLTVTPAKAPTIQWPTAGKLTYGQQLSESELKGGSTNLGTFAWQEDATMTAIGLQTFTLTFTPADTENYLWDDSKLVQSVKLRVDKRPVTIRADGKTKVYGAPDPALTATVEGLLDGDTIDYTLTRDPGETAGTYTIRVRASDTDTYTVTAVRGTLTISAQDVETLTPDTLPTQLYTGRAVKPAPIVRDAAGNVLKEGRDYTLTYVDNQQPGLGTVIVTGKGNYTGTLELTFPVVDPAESEALKAMLGAETGEDSTPPTLVYTEDGTPKDYTLLDVTGRMPDQEEAVRILLTEDTSGEASAHVLAMPADQLATLSRERGVRLLAFTHLNAAVLVPTEALLSGEAAKLAATALGLTTEPETELTLEQLAALRYEIRIAPVEGSDSVAVSVWLCWPDGEVELTPSLPGLLVGLTLTDGMIPEDWTLAMRGTDGTEAIAETQLLVVPDDLLDATDAIDWYSLTIHADGVEEVLSNSNLPPESCHRTLLCSVPVGTDCQLQLQPMDAE